MTVVLSKMTHAHRHSAPIDLDQALRRNRAYALQCRSQLRQESMEDQIKEEEVKQPVELARTPNAAKPDKNRKKAAKQIDAQRLYETIQYLKKHPQRP
jgi:hypothetical protein